MRVLIFIHTFNDKEMIGCYLNDKKYLNVQAAAYDLKLLREEFPASPVYPAAAREINYQLERLIWNNEHAERIAIIRRERSVKYVAFAFVVLMYIFNGFTFI